jgi:hypothetical protein
MCTDFVVMSDVWHGIVLLLSDGGLSRFLRKHGLLGRTTMETRCRITP